MSADGLKLENDLCRCCQAEGRFKSLSESPRGEESFSEMLKIALDIELKPVSDPLDRKMYSICDTCIKRLEDADNFKQQVLGCERVFQQLYAGDLIKVVEKEDPRKIIITIKEESDSDADEPMKDDYVDHQLEADQPEDKPGQMLLVEIPPKPDEEVTEISQSKSILQTILAEPLKKSGRIKKEAPKPAPAKTKRKPKAKPKTLDEKIKIAMDRQEKKKKKKEKKKPEDGDGDTSQGFRIQESDYTVIGGKTKCAHCDQVFAKLDYFRSHFKGMHLRLPRREFRCEICSERCVSGTKLTYHKLEKHNIDDRFKCNACDKSFTLKISLKEHLDSYHKLGQSMKCKFCDFETYLNKNMRKHMDKHKTVKDLQCKYCKKSFLRRNTLNFHERIHTGDRRKVCKECGQAFVQKASLNYHMAKHHPGVPF